MKIFLTGGSGFIGTNLINELLARGHEVENFDFSEPRFAEHRPYWIQGDLLDAPALAKAMTETWPDVVFHLAARADCDENTTVEEGYRANTDGTRHFLEAVRAAPSVKRAIIVSSQYVAGTAAGRG